MTQPAWITLTEAITTLAFGKPFTARDIGRAIEDGRLGAVRQVVLDRIGDSARRICSAGFAGEIECLGRRTSGLPDDPDRHVGAFLTLTREDYLGYPHYIAGYDSLWKHNDETGEKVEAGEFGDAFAGLASEECIGDVVVVRESFQAMLPARASGGSASTAKLHGVGSGTKAPPTLTATTAKLPRLPDARLQCWLESLSETERDLPQEVLRKRCLSAHPKNSITRERIRKLTPGRKRGPRRIGPNSTA